MSRYDLPDPKCNHAPKGHVMAGSFEGAHAATAVCDRPACIADALAWAEATCRQPAAHTPVWPPARSTAPRPVAS